MSPTGSRSAVISTLASLASLVAALSCCLPLGTLLLAAGSAGVSLFAERLRPWLLAFSAASLVFAFVQTYLRQRCAFRYRRLRTCLLWFSAVMVLGLLVFPQYLSAVLAGHIPHFTATGDLHDFNEREFIRQFDAAADDPRLVLLLSPT